MLVISLKVNEWVHIGDDIKVCNNTDVPIKLAIDAPRKIPIVRESAKLKEPKQS